MDRRPTPRRPTGATARWAAAVVLTTALVVRVVPAIDTVFASADSGATAVRSAAGGSSTRLLGNDPWYHLRHARAAASEFLHFERHDPWTNYPGGYSAPEIGLYAWSMGTVAWLSAGGRAPSEDRLRAVVAWTPAILGAAVHGVLMILAGSLWGAWTGVLAGALLLAYPGTFLARSTLGFSDHHVAEVLLALLVILGLVTVLRSVDGATTGHPTERPEAPWWRPALLPALPLVVLHFTWNGAPIHLLFVAMALLAVGMAAVARGGGIEAARSILRYGSAFTIAVAAVGFLFPVLVQTPDIFPRIVQSGTLLALGLPAYVLLARWFAGRTVPVAEGTVAEGTVADRTRSGWVAAAAFAIAVAGLAAYFASTGEGRWVWSMLSSRRTSIVREHTGALSAEAILGVLTPLGMIALVAPFLAPWVMRRRADVSWLPVVVVPPLVLGLWATTGDYDYLAAPMVALLATFVLLEGLAPLIDRLAQPRAGSRVRNESWGRTGSWVRAIGIGALLLIPLSGRAGPVAPWLQPEVVDRLMLYDDGWDEALAWIEAYTPPVDPSADDPGGYGVIAGWDFGNFIASVARRPVFWSQGPDTRSSSWLLAQSEESAEAILEREPGTFRYAVVDARTVGDFFAGYAVISGVDPENLRKLVGDVPVDGGTVHLSSFGDLFERSMAHRLYYANGSELAHHRLVFRSAHQSLTAYVALRGPLGTEIARIARRLDRPEEIAEATLYSEHPEQVVTLDDGGILFFSRVEPTVKVYERVEGATLVGTAPPRATVRAVTVLLLAEGDAPIDYSRTVAADAEGRFEIRVPHWTRSGPPSPGAATAAPYRVFTLADPTATSATLIADGVAISEADVREGRAVLVTPATPIGPATPTPAPSAGS